MSFVNSSCHLVTCLPKAYSVLLPSTCTQWWRDTRCTKSRGVVNVEASNYTHTNKYYSSIPTTTCAVERSHETATPRVCCAPRELSRCVVLSTKTHFMCFCQAAEFLLFCLKHQAALSGRCLNTVGTCVILWSSEGVPGWAEYPACDMIVKSFPKCRNWNHFMRLLYPV